MNCLISENDERCIRIDVNKNELSKSVLQTDKHTHTSQCINEREKRRKNYQKKRNIELNEIANEKFPWNI